MNKRESICAECKYHLTECTSSGIYAHCCYAKATDVKDFVTGYVDTLGIGDCCKINKDGDCPDFKSDPCKSKVDGAIDYIDVDIDFDLDIDF